MTKSNHEVIVTGIVLDDSQVFTLQEIQERFHLDDDLIKEMLEYGLFEKLDVTGLRRIQTAVHLHQDLDVNIAGAALVLELLEELEVLRGQLSILDRHLK